MAIVKVISHGKTNAGTRRLLQYVLDPKKTEPHLCAVSGDYPDEDITPQQVYREFQRVREMFGKDRTGGRTYTHGTVAFAPGEIAPEAAAESREEFCELMEQQYGWRVIWKDSRKNLTFENTDGKRVRDTNLNKTFNLNITKEALQYEFARNSGR